MATGSVLGPFADVLIVRSVCRCCLTHGDLPLSSQTVACTTCGEPCSCAGCVADA